MCRNAIGHVMMQCIPPKEACTGVLDYGDSPTPCVPHLHFIDVFSKSLFFSLKTSYL